MIHIVVGWLSGVGGRYIYCNFELTTPVDQEDVKEYHTHTHTVKVEYPSQGGMSLFMLQKHNIKKLHHFHRSKHRVGGIV